MSKKNTIEDFIIKANKIHNNKYDYSESVYINAITKIKITCNNHPIPKIFYCSPNKHISGQRGCTWCSKNRRYSNQEFIELCKESHGDKYDYSITKYSGAKNKITIICKNHGKFQITASEHIVAKHGCKACANNVSNKETKWLDKVINLPNDVNHRQVKIYVSDYKYYIVDGFDQITNTIYEFHGNYWHGNPKTHNANKINEVNKKTFKELYEITMEKEELIKSAGFNLINIWEEEFDKLKIN